MIFSSLPPIVIILFSSAIFLIFVAFIYALYIYLRANNTQNEIDTNSHGVRRHHANPVISPLSHREWETNGTFNPAAVEDDEGRVHLLYRAIGDDGLSNIGHASGSDGLTFDRRSAFPVYQPAVDHTKPDVTSTIQKTYNPSMYTSGGGWGGHEDPRAVRIGDRVYMTYTAFHGWESVRIAITSISIHDLKKERWNWKKPRLISPPHQVNKNWVLFPEKINGKYAILHTVSPEILIHYVDNIDDPITTQHIVSKAPHGGRKDFWDNWMRGAGAPPIKTDLGWLLLYHAMDKKDPNKYKLGAMILDTNDPTRIVYRSPEPILSPEMCYENDGKPGVVYASGAIIKDGNLMVYYGGGDKHVCVAQTGIDSLLTWLQRYGSV